MHELLLAQCANVAVPEATQEAIRYYNSGNLLWILQQATLLIFPLLFLIKGFTGRLAKFSERIGKFWYFSVVIYLVLFISIYSLLELPLSYYSGYVREHDFGLSNQTLARWFGNYGKMVLVNIVGAALFVWIFFLLLKKSPKRWWFYGSLAAIAILFIGMVIQPVWVDPLFNKFGPMQDKQLEKEILSLADRAGIANGKVYEVDKSSDTKTLNAYVCGFGPTHRIVLWDTIIKRMPSNQLLFVMGHEMGHYVLNHIWWMLLYASGMIFIFFILVFRIFPKFVQKRQKKLHFTHLYSIAALPLFLFALNLFMFLTSPLSNYVSRVMEHQADRFGLEITQCCQAAAEAFVTLQNDDLGIPRPGPIYTFWRASHPSLGARIDYCNSYCPWASSEPLFYGDKFKTK